MLTEFLLGRSAVDRPHTYQSSNLLAKLLYMQRWNHYKCSSIHYRQLPYNLLSTYTLL